MAPEKQYKVNDAWLEENSSQAPAEGQINILLGVGMVGHTYQGGNYVCKTDKE